MPSSPKGRGQDGTNQAQSPPEAPRDLGGFTLRVSNPEIWQVRFERRAGPGDERNTDAESQIHLKVQRPRENVVAVELAVESDEPEYVDYFVSCRVAILVEPTDENEVDYDVVLRDLAARIGPVVVYPYIREFLSSMTQRAGMEPIVLPVMNVGNMFDPESVRLPPAPKSVEDKSY